MRPTAGRWVSGDDFFDREGELRILAAHVRNRNHLLLTGQRRMGKTSIARELGRRLEGDGWIFLFADVEGSTCPEDAVATIAKETYPVRSIASRLWQGSEGMDWGEYRGSRCPRLPREDPGRTQRRQLAKARREAAPGVCQPGRPRAHGDRRAAHLPQAHAARRRRCEAGGRVPELDAGCDSVAGRRRPGLHRVRQHRAPATGPSPRDPGPNQPLLPHSPAALGPG